MYTIIVQGKILEFEPRSRYSLYLLFARYKTALSRVIPLSFCTKIPFFAALRANCYCSPLQKNVGKNVARSRYIYLAQPYSL